MMMAGGAAWAETSEEPAEAWIGPEGEYPPVFQAASIDRSAFAELHAEYLAGHLKIIWPGGPSNKASRVTLVASADEPGHWPARDWNPSEMTRRNGAWETRLPVVDIDVPFVYFVAVRSAESSGGVRREGRSDAGGVGGDAKETVCSPLRVCWPRRLGMEEPTRSFFPFLEGFEEPVWNWRLAGDAEGWGVLKTVPTPHTGKWAMAVTIPPGQDAARVLTTRVRGWQALRQGASGMRLWLKSERGPARARFTLLAHAGDTHELAAVHERTVELDTAWQDVNLLFADFPEIPLVAVDALLVEILGKESQTVLLDDLQLLGPWRLID